MAAIERTAYPRFKTSLTQSELDEFYTPTEAEITFINQVATGRQQQLALMILLKSFQKLGYLPRLSQVPEQIQTHIAHMMGWLLPPEPRPVPPRTRGRYRQAIHAYLDIQPYRAGGATVVEQIVRQAAQTMSDPADLINVAIEQLVVDRFAP